MDIQGLLERAGEKVSSPLLSFVRIEEDTETKEIAKQNGVFLSHCYAVTFKHAELGEIPLHCTFVEGHSEIIIGGCLVSSVPYTSVSEVAWVAFNFHCKKLELLCAVEHAPHDDGSVSFLATFRFPVNGGQGALSASFVSVIMELKSICGLFYRCIEVGRVHPTVQ